MLLAAVYVAGEANEGRLLKTLSKRVRDGDIVVVSSKYVAKSQGRVLHYAEVKARTRARSVSASYGLQPKEAEVILREAESTYGGIRGVLLTVKLGTLAPNAGIDHSNVPEGSVVLQPFRPAEQARRIAEKLLLYHNRRVALVIADSRLTPLRKGTTGVALAAYGVPEVLDERGKPDLYGRKLRITFRALADMLASAAEALIGEAGEGVPAVVIRGYHVSGRGAGPAYVSPNICLFIRGLKGGAQFELEPIEGEKSAAVSATV